MHTTPIATAPDTATATAAPDFDVPADVNALLDEASIPGGPYSATFTPDAVQLVETTTRAVVREVKWEQAGTFGRNILRGALGAVPAENVTASVPLFQR